MLSKEWGPHQNGTASADRIRASGHARRMNRPDTWQHPTTLHQRQFLSCQQGAVHTWLGMVNKPG